MGKVRFLVKKELFDGTVFEEGKVYDLSEASEVRWCDRRNCAVRIDELAEKELAEKELAEKELAEKELAEKELAEKELAEKELAEKEAALKEDIKETLDNAKGEIDAESEEKPVEVANVEESVENNEVKGNVKPVKKSKSKTKKKSGKK